MISTRCENVFIKFSKRNKLFVEKVEFLMDTFLSKPRYLICFKFEFGSHYEIIAVISIICDNTILARCDKVFEIFFKK